MAGVQMSPKKALRVAMLKSCFADTIFKDTHPTLSSIVEQLNAAEMASRERERNDARIVHSSNIWPSKFIFFFVSFVFMLTVENCCLYFGWKKTVKIDRPPNMLKDMDNLFGLYPNSKSLEQIRLFVKENYVEDDDPESEEIF
ncbi:hypothetical protein SASPL_135390 [Salvia splendens]|uniref:Uncharacterized protein n=1 Tax=Salvia splendens TaxID=180675 RepID=A0A8X8X025_SALSN|nr:uncharacterized protein LOC121761936 [Salvia splendens]KAG6403173.1 hypothetical protein SASPL_135390 [Salvia splendens]